MKLKREQQVPHENRRRTPDHSDAHAPIDYVSMNRILLPGGQDITCRHLEWDHKEKELKDRNEFDYVSDPLFRNCALPGDKISVRWNYETKQLEPVGTQGLLQRVEISDTSIDPGDDGYADILNGDGNEVVDGSIKVKNWTDVALVEHQSLWVKYYSSEDVWRPVHAADSIRPVSLTQTGGSQGTSEAEPTWTYTVKDGWADTALGTAVNPVASPHHWVRFIGHMTKATYGQCQLNSDGTFELLWINEQQINEACDEAGEFNMT